MSSKNQMKRGKNQSLYKYLPETWIDFSVRGKERKQYIAKVERWNGVKLEDVNCQAGVFKKNAQKEIALLIKNLQENQLRQVLLNNIPIFEKKLKKLASEEVGSDYIIQGIKESLSRLNEQLTLFGDSK